MFTFNNTLGPSLIRLMVSVDARHHVYFNTLGPSLISPMVTVDVKHHVYFLTLLKQSCLHSEVHSGLADTHWQVFSGTSLDWQEEAYTAGIPIFVWRNHLGCCAEVTIKWTLCVGTRIMDYISLFTDKFSFELTFGHLFSLTHSGLAAIDLPPLVSKAGISGRKYYRRMTNSNTFIWHQVDLGFASKCFISF